MILSHSIWLERGVVRFFLVPQKLGGLERPLTQGGVSLQQAEFQVMQYSVDAPNKTGILCHEFY